MGRRATTRDGRRGVRGPRIARDKKTVAAMTDMYCRDHHPSYKDARGLCPECRELLDYARVRLDRCPFGDGKPTCAKCEIHCYSPAQRQRIATVMRYSGPRMLMRHPMLAIWHLRDSFASRRSGTSKSGPPFV